MQLVGTPSPVVGLQNCLLSSVSLLFVLGGKRLSLGLGGRVSRFSGSVGVRSGTEAWPAASLKCPGRRSGGRGRLARGLVVLLARRLALGGEDTQEAAVMGKLIGCRHGLLGILLRAEIHKAVMVVAGLGSG